VALDPETRARFEKLDEFRRENDARYRARREELDQLKADFRRLAEELAHQGRRRRSDDVPA
jgi:hypothetical protein